jgi:hypothetical protein
MPYEEPDFSDPNELVGVVLPAGEEAMRDMAYVFAEEFARMGQGAEGILGLFQNPFYAGAHQAYRALGADAVRAIVRECVEVWGRGAGTVRDAAPAQAADGEWLPWPASAQAAPRPVDAAGMRSTTGRGD